MSESALGRAAVILRTKGPQDNIVCLYDRARKDFESIDQFLLTLDVLFILGHIEVDMVTGAVTYAD